MKKISLFSLISLLGICVACQGIEIPPSATSTSPIGTATSSTIGTATRSAIGTATNTIGPEADSTPGNDPSSTIAFYSHRDGNLEIYLMDADGSEQRRVTSGEYDDDSPALSPDGSQIAFISNRNDPNPGACSHSCFYQLYIVNADGSAERGLIETEFSTTHPDWHPDGTRISFDTETNLQGDIYVVDADGGNLQLLIEDGFWADWSPDGQQIVFASQREGSVELYLANADGSNQRRLTQNGKMEYFPDWSPDGQRIAYTVLQDRAIYVIDVDGGNEGRVTRQAFAENPSWSPDGNWIAYQSDDDGDFEIYAINVAEALAGEAGSTPIKLTDNHVGDLWPSWGLNAELGVE